MEMRITVFYFGMLLSAAGGEKKQLAGLVGGNLTLPDSLMEFGFLLVGRRNIAMVEERKLEILEKIYTSKLHWNKKTGLFTITDLQKTDSGVYVFDSKKGKVFKSAYDVMVYDPAPPPAVRRLNVSSERCLLQCWVDKETELSWYRDEKILNQSRSDVSLLLAVDKQDFSSSYTCVSANPAENKTHEADINTLCREGNTAGSLGGSLPAHDYIIVVTGISIKVILIVVLSARIIHRKYFRTKRSQ